MLLQHGTHTNLKTKSALERIQRRVAHFVKGNYDPYASVSEMIADLGWPSLESRRRQSRLCYMFKYVHNLTRVDHTQHMVLTPPSARMFTPFKISKPQCSTNYLNYSFFPNTIKDWNSLPTAARSMATLDQFKGYLNQGITKANPI